MAESKLDPSLLTRSSMFLHLKETDPGPREIAWSEFFDRYGPIIRGYARRRGATADQADDVVQEVMQGFYRVSPLFEYDRTKGRFRGYLKHCTMTAVLRVKAKGKSHEDIEDVDPASPQAEESWAQVWDEELLRKAMTQTRSQFKTARTYEAFELNVVNAMPAQAVADKLGISIESVHQAKSRVSKAIRAIYKQLEEEYG